MRKTVTLRRSLITSLFLFAISFPILGQVSFTTGKLTGTTLTNPTSLQFGPDNKLYVAQQDGTIHRYSVAKTNTGYNVTATETILLVKNIKNHNDNGTLNTSITKRQVTGILVTGTAANPKIYVTSSDPRIGGSTRGDYNLDTNSGILSLLTYDGTTWNKTDLVRGMARSEENHAQNGLALDAANNILYIASGGNTNAGSPSVNFAMTTEYTTAACILKIDLNQINAMPVNGSGNEKYVYDLPTLDDPTRSGNPDTNDPFGGNDGLNQAKLVAGGPVQVFAPGYRNPYDVIIMKTGTLAGYIYTIDNGPNQGWGGYPDKEGTPDVTNNYVSGEPGSSGPGVNDAQVNNKDNLHLVWKPGDLKGFYGGHPAPIRANPAGAGLFWQDGAGVNHFELTPTSDWPPVPLDMADPQQSDYRNPGVNDGALTTFLESTNGMAEYTSSQTFSGQLTGEVLTVSFDGNMYRIKLSNNGQSVASKAVLASGFGSTPLDITTQGDNDVFPGTIWVADYIDNAVYFFNPVSSSTETWANVVPADNVYPEKRHENAFVEANGKLYLIGGRSSRPVNMYDPSANAWTSVAPVPANKELHHFQAVSLGGKIYVINAFTGAYPNETPVPDIYIYDVASNSWEVKTNAIPQERRRGSGAAVVYNNKIYLAGGIVNGHSSGTVKWTDVYDPAANSWQTLADAPTARDHVHGAVIDGKIYLAAGRRTSASTGVVFTDTEASVDVYDIATNTWTKLPGSANIPVMRAGAAAVNFNGKLLVIGGESSQSLAHNDVNSLDPVSNTWSSLPKLVTGRHGTGAVVFNGKVYIAAGNATQGGGNELNSMEAYPSAAGSACSGNTTSTTLDDDGDGYSNKDEADNGTDPCSAASKPKDNDNDKISNLNDPDDDNDGIPDISDKFHIDAQNGTNKFPPFAYPFLNGDPGTGLFGMGFTGLMSNGTDPDNLYKPSADGFIMGGAVGLASYKTTAGSPLNNNQEQAFQFGVMINSGTPPVTVESALINPYFNSADPSTLKDELHGIYIGTGDQDNYLLFALTPNFGNPGLTVIQENAGVLTQAMYPITGILDGNIVLFLSIDPANGTVQPRFKRVNDPDTVDIGQEISLSGALLNAMQGPAAVATGILASSRTGTSFSAVWDYMNLYLTQAPDDQNVKRINTGGPGLAAGGKTWMADEYYSGTTSLYSTTNSITNTDVPVVYQTERYGSVFNYNIPVANGTYSINLHFAEIYFAASGKRIFNVDVENGQGTVTNLDIFSEAGKDAALIKHFQAAVTDGVLNINFTALVNNAKICAIEIIPSGSAPLPVNPVANAGPDKTVNLPANSVLLNGSGTDADGSVVSYQWTQVTGPNTATINSSTIASPTIGNLVQGSYKFSLVVKDNEGNSSAPDEVLVTVNPASGIQVTTLMLVSSTGNTSTQQDLMPITDGMVINLATLPTNKLNVLAYTSPNIVGSVLFKLSGQQNRKQTESQAPYVLFGDNKGAYNSWTPALGNYTLSAVPYSERSGKGTAGSGMTVNFTVVNQQTGNQPPTANAGPDKTITLPTNSVVLNGSGTDNDGTITAYQWTQVNGPNTATISSADIAQPTVSGLVQGQYTFRLIVTDNANTSSTGDDVVVTVNPETTFNQPPVANAGTDKSITLPTNSVVLNGSGTDSDGTISAYQWTQVNGPNTATINNLTIAQPTVSGLVEGIYTFSLTVKDDDNALSAADQVIVTVNPAASGPQVAALVLVNSTGSLATQSDIGVMSDGMVINLATLPSRTINVKANTSPETIGSVVFQLSGTQARTQTESAAPYVLFGDKNGAFNAWTPAIGSYTLIATPYSSSGGNGTKGSAVIVNFTVIDQATNSTAPVANAGPDQSVALPTNSVVLAGSGTDSDGSIVSYQWTQVSGPNTAVFSSNSIASPTISGLVQGNYTFSLVVKDNQNNSSAPDQVQVTVNPDPTIAASLRVNSGGPTLNFNGEVWNADQYFTGINNTYAAASTTAIGNTENDALYRTERYGTNFGYAIPLSSGTYTVVLHFAEIYRSASGMRVFNVDVENGQGTLSNFDIYAVAGKNVAVTRVFTITVSDGILNIGFTSVTDNAKISGIEIIPGTASAGTLTTIVAPEPVAQFEARVAPNPSAGEFRLTINGGDNTPVSIRIVSASGIMMDQLRNVNPDQVFRFGQNYPIGTYYIEVIQSGIRRVMGVIKQ